MLPLDNTNENTHIIEWHIKNFSSCNIQHGEKLECPVSTAGNLFHTRWTLYIYPNGKRDPDFLSCYVSNEIIENVEPQKLDVGFAFSLIAFDGVVAYTKFGRGECETYFSDGFSKFYKLKKLFKKKQFYLQSDTLIIRCKLRMFGPKSIQTSEQIFRTEFPTETFTTRLTLHNFCGTTKQNLQIFDLEDSNNLLSLNVSMNKDETFKEQNQTSSIEGENPETLESYLHMVMVKQEAKNAMHISCGIKVLSNNMDVAVDKEISHLFSKIDAKEEWVLPYFVDTENLPHGSTENGTLYFEVKLTICDRKPFSERMKDLTSPKLKADSEESPLMDDLEGLQKTSKMSDVILQVDDKTFPVHKSILAAESPRTPKLKADSKEPPPMNDLDGLHKTSKVPDVILQVDDKTFPGHKSILSAKSRRFEQIFKHLLGKTTNSSQPIIKLDDVNKNTMALLLKFIYTDKLKELENLSDRKCILLYAAAQKYEISSLQSRCISIFRKKLGAKYVFNALMMAESWNDSDLKLIALDCFADHHKYLFSSPEWETFIDEHEKLAHQVLRHVRFKKPQQSDG